MAGKPRLTHSKRQRRQPGFANDAGGPDRPTLWQHFAALARQLGFESTRIQAFDPRQVELITPAVALEQDHDEPRNRRCGLPYEYSIAADRYALSAESLRNPVKGSHVSTAMARQSVFFAFFGPLQATDHAPLDPQSPQLDRPVASTAVPSPMPLGHRSDRTIAAEAELTDDDCPCESDPEFVLYDGWEDHRRMQLVEYKNGVETKQINLPEHPVEFNEILEHYKRENFELSVGPSWKYKRGISLNDCYRDLKNNHNEKIYASKASTTPAPLFETAEARKRLKTHHFTGAVGSELWSDEA